MSEKSNVSIGGILIVVVLAALGLWVVWGLLAFLFSALKGLLTLALVGLALYGVYRLGKKLERP